MAPSMACRSSRRLCCFRAAYGAPTLPFHPPTAWTWHPSQRPQHVLNPTVRKRRQRETDHSIHLPPGVLITRVLLDLVLYECLRLQPQPGQNTPASRHQTTQRWKHPEETTTMVQRELHALASHPRECPARKTTLPDSGRSCPTTRVHALPVLLPRELRIQVRDLARPIAAAAPCRRRPLRHRCYTFPQTAHTRSSVPPPHRNVSRVSFIALG